MRRSCQPIFSLLISLLLFHSTVLSAQDVVVKDIESRPSREEYFTLLFSTKQLILRLPAASKHADVVMDRGDLKITPSAISIAGKSVFDTTGVYVEDSVLSYNRITDLLVSDSSEFTVITFFTGPTAMDRTAGMRRGNRISFAEPISVAKGDFVRGMIFTVRGAVKVDGEVNKDVVSLFNSITVTMSAVIRGDVASIQGKIDVAREASVYGEAFSGNKKKVVRKHRLYRSEDAFSWSPLFYYNRVDGATPKVKFRLRDPDSTLPTVYASVGYGFESSSWRLRAGLEQSIYRPRLLTVGGLFYRDLLSDDDWILSDKENTIFALVVNEDFKDYYEGIGGTGFISVNPIKKLQVTAGYRGEVTNWLPAHRNLWSLFGGDKRFPDNFTTVPEELRVRGIPEIDTGRFASLYARIDFDRRASDPFSTSAWALSLNGEYSHPDLGSDFNYKRFTFSARRYQKITPSTMALLRGMVGGSDGYLPMNRRFYLGGLGTLQGYRHKEFIGNRFWMTNLELRQNVFKTDFAVSFLWDVGEIGSNNVSISDLETYQSVGGALYLGDDVKISVAKRLDGSKMQSTRIYVRLEHVF